MDNLHLQSNLSYGVGELAELRDLMLSLSKGVRASRQYPPEHPIPQQFKQSFRDHLARYFEHSDRLVLRTAIDSFEAADEVVYRAPINSDNLAHLLHRDGVRLLEICPAISNHEIDSLFDAFVACSGNDDGRSDVVNRFWQAGFENVKYEVVDSFESGEVTELFSEFEEVETPRTSVATRVSFTPGSNVSWPMSGQTLDAQAEETHRFMQRSFAEAEKLSIADQRALAAMIEDDRAKDLKRDVVDLLLQLCAENTGPQDVRLSIEALQSTFDRLIQEGNFGTLHDIVIRVQRLLEHETFDSAVVKKRLKEFEARCGDSVRVKMITGVINRKPDINLSLVESYLAELGWESLNQLVWMLGELAHYPARRMVCDLLVRKGFEKIDILGSAVYDSRWYVARNVVWVLGEMKTLQAIPFLTKAAKHNEPRVKTEVIKALGNLGGDKAATVLLTMLKDESEKIRAQAARELGQNRTRVACQGLAEIVRDKDFQDVPPVEMRQILEAMVVCGADSALTVCEEILAKSALFNKARLHRLQEVTISAMALSTDLRAGEILERLCGDRRSHIAAAARRVQAMIKSRREER